MAEVNYNAPQPSGLGRDSIYALAAIVGEKFKYNPGEDLEPIVSALGGRIEFQNFWELESTTSGSIQIRDESDFVIYIAAHTGPMRDRFTIAHELGHYFLHYLYPTLEGKTVGPIQAQRYGSGRVEWEANWFAAGFLMPEKQFKTAFAKAKGGLIQVAAQFGVSVPAAEIRARSLKLI